jgi:hypothetical protein
MMPTASAEGELANPAYPSAEEVASAGRQPEVTSHPSQRTRIDKMAAASRQSLSIGAVKSEPEGEVSATEEVQGDSTFSTKLRIAAMLLLILAGILMLAAILSVRLSR